MRCFVPVVLFAAIASPARAVDSDAAKPYELQIVLRIAPHRLLTPAFRRQLASDLRDAAQASLGPFGHVEVVDADAHPGAWISPDALDSLPSLQPTKRHFVQVEFTDGHYVVSARQHDGATGLASPRVRTARTAARAFVARLAARFLDLDFGATGTVIGKDDDGVRLQLRGGALAGFDGQRWAPPGSVFALARIEGEPPRGRAVPATYLQVVRVTAGGVAECRLVSRFLNPLADWPAVQYRALRLGTVTAPIHLRLTDPNGLPHQNLLVLVSPTGFRASDAVTDQGPARDGTFQTSRPYSGLAFVRIITGQQQRPFPVAVLDEQPVVCVLDAAADGASRQQFDYDVRNVRQRLQDILRRLAGQKSQLDSLLRESRNKEALDRVQSSIELLDSELTAMRAEVSRLRRDAEKQQPDATPLLDQCDDFLRELRARRESLGRFEAELRKAHDAESSAENQARRDRYLELLHRAETQREDADFDGAIETYQKILADFGARPDVQRKLDDLKAAWALKSDAHRQAREFAYGPWARMQTFDELRLRLPEARRMFAVCRSVGDKLTALKFSIVASNTATDLVIRTVEELQHSGADSDTVNLKTANQVRNDLQAFLAEISAFLRDSKAGK